MSVNKGAVVIDTKINSKKIADEFGAMESKTQSLINKWNKQLDSIKSQEFAIEKIRQKIEQLQFLGENGLLKDTEAQNLINLNSQFEIMQDKLSQTKDEAFQTRTALNEIFNEKSEQSLSLLDRLKNAISGVGEKAKDSFINKFKKGADTAESGLDGIGKKLDSFKNRMTRMIGTAMIFSLLRSGLNSLRNGFISMLKSNDDFSNSLAQIKGNLMTAFAPIYNACLPAINALMSALNKITATIAQFTAGIFGKSIKNTTKQAKQLSSSLGGVAKSGEEATGSLAGFDNLEVIGGSDSNSGGGAGGGSDYDFSGVENASTKMLDYLNKLKEMWNNGEWFKLGETLGKSLSDALEKVDVEGFFEKLKTGVKNFAQGINGFLEGFDFSILGNKISDTFRGLLQTVTTFISEIDWHKVGESIVDFLCGIDWGGLLLDLWNLIVATIIGFIDFNIGIVDKIVEKLSDPEFLNQMVESGKNLFLGLVNGMLSIFDKIGEVFNKIIVWFKKLFGISSPSTLFLEFGKFIIEGLINGISSLIGGVITVFINIFNSAKDAVVNIIQSIITFITTIPQKILSALASIPEIFRNAFQKAKDKITSIWNSVTSMFSNGGKIFSGLKEGIANTFKKIVNSLIDGINKVISTPFNSINKLLNKIRNADILGVQPFKSFWSNNPLPVPKIPKLATGTVIPPRQEFLALLGDQRHGTNIEAPLETIKQANREVLNEYLEKFGNNDKEIILRNAQFIIQFGNKNFQKMVMDSIRLSEKEYGKQLLVS